MRTIVGKEVVDYVSKKSGDRVQGIKLHCTYDSTNVEGLSVESAYFSSKHEDYPSICKLAIGAQVRFFYNRFGNVESVGFDV